jgi:hypothetical protein
MIHFNLESVPDEILELLERGIQRDIRVLMHDLEQVIREQRRRQYGNQLELDVPQEGEPNG